MQDDDLVGPLGIDRKRCRRLAHALGQIVYGGFERVRQFNTRIAPKLTIRGGTTEILRVVVARGLGLR